VTTDLIVFDPGVVTTLRLNNPPLNLVSRELIRALDAALEEVEYIAISLAETLASRGPVAVREAKGVLDAALDIPLDEGLAGELEASERVFSFDDMLEGTAAFIEKRSADFDNR
jgi:enoyl-CoA hydratase/carnithine racemase